MTRCVCTCFNPWLYPTHRKNTSLQGRYTGLHWIEHTQSHSITPRPQISTSADAEIFVAGGRKGGQNTHNAPEFEGVWSDMVVSVLRMSPASHIEYRICDMFVIPSAKDRYSVLSIELQPFISPHLACNHTIDRKDDGQLDILNANPRSPWSSK